MLDIGEAFRSADLIALAVDGTLVDTRKSQLVAMNLLRDMLTEAPPFEMADFEENIEKLNLAQRAKYLSTLPGAKEFKEQFFLTAYDNLMTDAKPKYDQVIPGVAELFTHLENTKLAYMLITNASKNELELSEASIRQTHTSFNPIHKSISAQECGFPKPDPLTMRYVIHKVRVNPNRAKIVYIGDTETDMEFAQNVEGKIGDTVTGVYIGKQPSELATYNYDSLISLVKNLH